MISLGTLNINGLFAVSDTSSIDMTLGGTGTALDPLVLSATVIIGTEITTTPTTTGTTVIDSGENAHIFDAAATIASHTITLPAATSSFNKTITIVTTHTITALTVGAVTNTVAGMPTTLTANQALVVRLFGTVWRRVSLT